MPVAQVGSSRRPPGPIAYIVDPEAHSRICIAEALLQNGFVCREFARIADLFGAFEPTPPHLIVLDVSVQDFDAVELVRSLAARRFLGGLIPVGRRDRLASSKLLEIIPEQDLKVLPGISKPIRRASIEASLHRLDPLPSGVRVPVDLEQAIRNGWMQLWYQPKIDLHRLSIVGAEALVRIVHPKLGLVPPACFLPDSTDPAMRLLSEFVIERALSDWMSFMDERRAFEIAINVPMQLLDQRGFIKFFTKRMPLNPRFAGMIVEINDADPMNCRDRVVDLAAELRRFKIRLSIDTVTRVAADLATVEPFPFGEIKVGRQFVSDCASDKLKRAFCRTVVDLTHRLGARATAVGVETGEDLAAVQELGFDLAQGFFFGRPMPADQLALLTAMRRGGFRSLRSSHESITH